jgi:hypothetical protein
MEGTPPPITQRWRGWRSRRTLDDQSTDPDGPSCPRTDRVFPRLGARVTRTLQPDMGSLVNDDDIHELRLNPDEVMAA